MKLQTLLGASMLTVAALSVASPASAAHDSVLLSGADITFGTQTVFDQDGTFEIARQGRGRGRGGDDNRGHGGGGDNRGDDGGHGADDNGNGNASGSGRSKPRIPGGSGCDDPGDIQEHSGCRS